LFVTNFVLIINNQTIIEQSDKERFPSKLAINQYDMGWKRNIESVFGANPFIWLIPCCANNVGEGLIFETAEFRMF